MPSRPTTVKIDFKVAGFRLRERRKALGMSVQQVANVASVARFTVVRLEKGLPCHRKTLEKIRIAVRLFTDQMMRPIEEPLNCVIQRGQDLRWSVAKSKKSYQRSIDADDPVHVDDQAERKRLGSLGLQPFFTAIFQSELSGGMTTQALMEMYQASWVDRHFGEEFVYVLRGPVTLSIEGIPHRLDSGDSITFDANLPHQYAPSEPIGAMDPPALILLVVTKK